MKKLLFLIALPLLGQQSNVDVQPDCSFNFGPFTAANTAPNPGFSNVQPGCTYWVFEYKNTGFSALSIVLQGAPDSSGNPGSWTTYAGTVATGANPQTSTTGGYTTISGTATNLPAWVRINLTSATGTGQVTGRAYGWRATAASIAGGGGGSSGCVGTAGTPCIVAGPDAPGAASTKNPVQVAGNDGTNVRAIKTDTAGDSQVVGPDAPAATATQSPVQIAGYGSSSVVLPFQSCDQQSVFTSSGTGETRIVALSSGKKVRVCYLDFTPDTSGNAVNFQLDYGTGATCGTGTTQLTSLLSNVLAYSNSWSGPQGVPVTPVSQSVCFNQTSNFALHGMVIYAFTTY